MNEHNELVTSFLLALALTSCSHGHRPPSATGDSFEIRQTAPARAEEEGPALADEVTCDTVGPDENGETNEPSDLPSVSLAEPAMSDAELGQLMQDLSEPTGEFPSDNYITNETSYLHVAPTFLDPQLKGRVYVGVGPEQNLSYLAMLRPEISYLVDIRRGNMLEHLLFRALIEKAPSRDAFLRRLTARPRQEPGKGTLARIADIEQITEAIAKQRPSKVLTDLSLEDTIALSKRIELPLTKADRLELRQIISAFAYKGVNIRYTMEGTKRPYPSLAKLLAATDLAGVKRSFMASEESYEVVRSLLKANRVVPIVGDFNGDHALRAVGNDIKQRSLQLGVFYTSNVEQYLFPPARYKQFVENVRALSSDKSSVIVRVWFDQGRAHPHQLKGHRTTSLVMPVTTFLERWDAGTYRSYWDVATDSAP